MNNTYFKFTIMPTLFYFKVDRQTKPYIFKYYSFKYQIRITHKNINSMEIQVFYIGYHTFPHNPHIYYTNPTLSISTIFRPNRTWKDTYNTMAANAISAPYRNCYGI